jgi:rod shape-determining protein MreD
MSAGAALRASAVVFAAAVIQAGLFSSIVIRGGAPDVLLVVVISIGLLRGSVPGAVFGFAGGLIIDLATLDTLGLTALILTLAGFWAGRYAETTARGRRLPVLLAVGVMTILASVFGLALHYMLGEDVVPEQALVTALLPTLVLNLVLALPIYALVRAVVGDRPGFESSGEVELVV